MKFIFQACEQDFEVGLRSVKFRKKKGISQEIRPKHLPGIYRPQKRDQTEIYNEKYFERVPKF